MASRRRRRAESPRPAVGRGRERCSSPAPADSSATTSWRRRRAAGRRRGRRSTTPTLDVTDRDAVLGAITTLRPDAVVNCRGVDRRRRLRERSRTGRSRPTRWPCAGSPRAATGSAPTSCTCQHRLRLRRHARPAVPRVGRDGPAVGVRRVEARRRAARRGARAGAAIVRTSWVCGEHGVEHGQAPSCAWPPSGRRRAGVRRRPDGATRRSRPTSPRCCAGWPSTGARACTTSRTRARCSGTSSSREVSPPPATTRRWCARSRPPSSIRRGRRRARPTACSTTPCCAPPGIPLLRDFRQPLAELVARLRR